MSATNSPTNINAVNAEFWQRHDEELERLRAKLAEHMPAAGQKPDLVAHRILARASVILDQMTLKQGAVSWAVAVAAAEAQEIQARAERSHARAIPNMRRQQLADRECKGGFRAWEKAAASQLIDLNEVADRVALFIRLRRPAERVKRRLRRLLRDGCLDPPPDASKD